MAAIAAQFEPSARSRGRHILVTAGPTHEPIDPVRFLGNRSSGKQGFAIAAALADRGARVTLVAGPVAPGDAGRGAAASTLPRRAQMAAAVDAALPADAAVLVAAVGRLGGGRCRAGQAQESRRSAGPDADAQPRHPRPTSPKVRNAAAPRRRLRRRDPRSRSPAAVAKRARQGSRLDRRQRRVGCDVMGGVANTVHLVTAEAASRTGPTLSKVEVAAPARRRASRRRSCRTAHDRRGRHRGRDHASRRGTRPAGLRHRRARRGWTPSPRSIATSILAHRASAIRGGDGAQTRHPRRLRAAGPAALGAGAEASG